jgi:glutamate transport system substrate-binding protein
MSRILSTRALAVGIAGLALVGGLAACGGAAKKDAAPSGPMPSLPAGSVMDAWQKKGKIEVGVKYDQPGFGQVDTAGKTVGFDIKMAEVIEKAVFGTSDGKHLHFSEALTANREAFLADGKVDFIIATYTINDERKQKVDFAGPYYEAGQTIMVKAGDNSVHKLEDLGGKKVCSVINSTSLKNLIKMVPTANTDIVFNQYTECAAAVTDGRVDAETTDNVILNGIAAQSDGKLKVLNDITFTKEPYGIGVKKGNPDLVAFMNQAIKEAEADGTWAKDFADTAGKLGIPTPQPPAMAS